MEKICLYCKHFAVIQRSPDYSEFTPGEQHEIHCGLGYFYIDPDDDTADILATKFKMAETCEKYEKVR